MRDKRKPGVPLIYEVFDILNSSEETTTTDEENQINYAGPSEELFHTEDNLNSDNEQNDSENASNDDQSDKL